MNCSFLLFRSVLQKNEQIALFQKERMATLIFVIILIPMIVLDRMIVLIRLIMLIRMSVLLLR